MQKIKQTIWLLFALCMVTPGKAQVRNYTFSSQTTTYTPITGGTQHGNATVDDASYTGISLGFSIIFNGTSYSTISINTNGYIALGNSIYETYNPINDPDGTSNIISALAYDIKGRTGAELRSQAVGSTPSRVFVVQWKNFQRYSSGTADSFDFQIRLYETSNKVEIRYGRCVIGSYTSGVDNLFEVGLRGMGLTDFNNISVTNTNNWTNSATGKTNDATCIITTAIKPVTGLSFMWENISYGHDVVLEHIFTQQGCGLTNMEDVAILVTNNGLNTESLIPVAYRINSNSVEYDTISTTLYPDSSILFTFGVKADYSAYGEYNLLVWSSLSTDSFRNNDTLFGYHIFSAPLIQKMPYNTNFEQSNFWWHGVKITGPMPWEYGSPAQTHISSAHSGQKAWMTDLSANYLNTSHSYLESPCFDFTGFSNPALSFYMRMETETKWDPMVVEASIDHGRTWVRVDSSNTSFYNTTSTGGPFPPPYFSGDNNSWIKYTASLLDFANQPSVNLRFRFYSDGSTVYEGIAIDDVEIFAEYDVTLKSILVAQDSSCGDTAQVVRVVIRNTGKHNLYNIPLTVIVSGDLVDTFTGKVTSLLINKNDTLTLGTLNTNAGGNIHFKAFSKYNLDQCRSNDSLETEIYFKTGVPVGFDIVSSQPFSGFENSGTENDPDVGCLGDSLSYLVQLPQGFSYQSYGQQWWFYNLSINTGSSTAPADTVFHSANSLDSNYYLDLVMQQNDADSLYQFRVEIAQANGCRQAVSRFVKGGETVEAKFTVKENCLGQKSNFINKSTVSSGTLACLWDFDNGDTSHHFNPVQVLYASADSFIVELTATSVSGCEDFFEDTTVVHETPVVDFSFQDVCEGDTTLFANLTPSLSDTVSYNWNLGDGTYLLSQGYVFHKYDTGHYSVRLTGESVYGCADTIFKNVDIYPLPVPEFDAFSVCFGDSIRVVNKSYDRWNTSFSPHWNFNGLDSSILENPVFMPPLEGKYNITLVLNTSLNCKDSLIKQVEVYSVPVASFSFLDNDLCVGDSLKVLNHSFIDDSTQLFYQWKFDNGDSSSGFEPAILQDSSGNYPVYLFVQSGYQCSSSDSGFYTVYETPEVSFSVSDTGLCPGDTFYFTNTSFVNSNDSLLYAWYFGNEDSAQIKDPVFNTITSGIKLVTLKVGTGKGCREEVSKKVEVYPVPSAYFGYQLKNDGWAGFIADDTTLAAYLWLLGDGDSAFVYNPLHQYVSDKNYIVYLTTTNKFGCMNNDSLLITVKGAGTNNLLAQPVKIFFTNPFRDELILTFNSDVSTSSSIRIFDMQGKLCIEKDKVSIPYGKTMVRLNIVSLPAAVYFIRFDFPGNSSVSKMILKRE